MKKTLAYQYVEKMIQEASHLAELEKRNAENNAKTTQSAF